jgi:Amt family ammonium transporter
LDGNFTQLGKQALGVGVAMLFAGVGTFVIAKVLKAVMGLRTEEQVERDGLDLHVHGERGYHLESA